MARIVLAHGILGFGSVLPQQPINYFNGIRALYERLGHEVCSPRVATLGSLAARARDLEKGILDHWKQGEGDIHIVAHSMGGLDARRMLATNPAMAARVKRLITIATPYFGSPVADAFLTPLGLFSPLAWISDLFADDAGALEDLQTRQHLQDPVIGGVICEYVRCDASRVHPRSALFAATEAIGQFGADANDGVVSVESASLKDQGQGLIGTWPTDHGGAIGWPSDGLGHRLVTAVAEPPADHIQRYEALLTRLLA